MSEPLPAGWKEFADFPAWGLRRVKVKLDTGAKTTAIGVARCDLRPLPGGGAEAELTLALYRRFPARTVKVIAPVVGVIAVRNSGGCLEQRPVIETTITLGAVTKRIRATVTDRSRMLVKVILGRSALDGEFVVDPAQKYLLPNARG